ncbi:Polysaccharide deacetylase [Nostocoides australiense Ben110]|uniref:Polysaccharide deacetylase n=1 Tax=Nostocoides australiense Ben110 TaxID=1193182 RepID=W6K1W8_9MICO|nr:polysaccharide deacetylase family protein [Tetrasphaera australiensis]CCH72309.1 Polysaccharide deacetylase [Tetrasphaera australiensis Ben110]
MSGLRHRVKRLLAMAARPTAARGATLLIYHRVGGGTSNELDLDPATFARHLDILASRDVLSLDAALDRLDRQDERPSYVLTFDDGFADVFENAWPLLRERQVPFTIYLATAYVGSRMRWEGSTATGAAGAGLAWGQIEEMVGSGLCTVGNHTHRHVPPGKLTVTELDECTDAVQRALGIRPAHFTYPWGVAAPAIEPQLRSRFRSASTGVLGRNLPATDRMRLARVPVRRTDPDAFFAAKLTGRLGPERAYAVLVGAAKRAGPGA